MSDTFSMIVPLSEEQLRRDRPSEGLPHNQVGSCVCRSRDGERSDLVARDRIELPTQGFPVGQLTDYNLINQRVTGARVV